MTDAKYDGILLIDEEFKPMLSQQEANELKPLQKRFMESYVANRDKMDVREWLRSEMVHSLPDHDRAKVEQMADEIVDVLEMQEEKKASLSRAIANGRSKENWLAGELKQATSHMQTQQSAEYLHTLDQTVANANAALSSTIHTKAGAVSQNSNLDGFIAEQRHAQTFNINAAAKGSPYRAKVLEPEGKYAKNSVDIVVVDGNDKAVRRYQSKYCKDAETTATAFEKGDYRGQQKLVPSDQLAEMPKKATAVIEAPDGTTSTALSKDSAKQLQKEAQSGHWNDMNWNDYRFKDIAIGVGKQVGASALMGVAMGAGTNIIEQAWNGEEIDGEQVVKSALAAGADFGIKAATAGALKVASEKGIISIIPKGTPAGTIANIAYVGIENIKVVSKMATGELTFKEGVDKLQQTTVSTVAGIAASAKGASIGASVGTVLGPAGAAVGGLVGGAVGYMAGATVGQVAVKVMQKVRDKVYERVEKVADRAREAGRSMADGVRNIGYGISSFFSGLFA